MKYRSLCPFYREGAGGSERFIILLKVIRVSWEQSRFNPDLPDLQAWKSAKLCPSGSPRVPCFTDQARRGETTCVGMLGCRVTAQGCAVPFSLLLPFSSSHVAPASCFGKDGGDARVHTLGQMLHTLGQMLHAHIQGSQPAGTYIPSRL